MMTYPSLEELLYMVDSKYTVCIMAAKRARDIVDKESKGLVVPYGPYAYKPVSVALEEVAQGRLGFVRTKSGIK